MKMRDIKQSIEALRTREMVKLNAWLHALIQDRESALKARGTTTRHEVLQAHQTARKTYRLELVSCGKERCKCVEGALHGPYWYAYWTEGGKTKSQYVGKKLPRGVKTRKGSNKRESDKSYVIHLPKK
jgi:hypothetical protein